MPLPPEKPSVSARFTRFFERSAILAKTLYTNRFRIAPEARRPSGMRLGASSFETVKKALLEFYESNQITHDLCSAQLRPETVPERKIVRCGQERDQVAEAAQSYAKAAQFEAVVSASGELA